MTSPTSNAVSNEPEITRFVAFDISKRSSVVAAVDAKQQIVLPPRKISIERFQTWITQNLKATDKVVIEATSNAWYYYDLLKPLAGLVVVANPYKVRLIAEARVKTDSRDAIALARLLAADLMPTVWVPPLEVRELRALVAQRQRLVRQRTAAYNRLQAIIATYHLLPPEGDPFCEKHQLWWEKLEIPAVCKLMIQQELTLVKSLAPLIEQVDQELLSWSRQGEWASQSAFLIQLPGIGVHSAMVVLSAIGDITRFESAKDLVGYSGLGASIWSSGQVTRQGSITKQGRRELRTTLVESAWKAVEQEGSLWKEKFERLASRIGRGKAIIAIARKLLVVIWNVLSKQEADRHAQEELVGCKLLLWGYRLKKTGRQGLSGPQFVRQELDRLKLGQNLNQLKRGGIKLKIPPPSPPLKVAVEVR
jgi:transposase